MSTLEQHLRALAWHLRDPEAHPPPPGMAPRGLAIYRTLIVNNLDTLLAGTFPVIHRTLGDAGWQALLRRFLREHRSRTPLFPELSREFADYLAGYDDPAHPWLGELAHYEWAELGLQLLTADAPAHTPDADSLQARPLRSPLAWPLAYRWPVHRIGPDHQPDTAPDIPTLLLLHRQADGTVRFSLLSPLLYQLLALADGQRSGEQLLHRLAEDAGLAYDAAFRAEALPMLRQLYAHGVLVAAAATTGSGQTP